MRMICLMRHHHRLAAAMLALLLAGCFGSDASQTPEAAEPSTPASASAGPSTARPAATSRDTAEPVPTEDLEPFTCDLPLHVHATTARANIVDVRVGTHADYDRMVFEFTDGLPEMTLDRVEPPFRADGSGMPIVVEGESFLRVIMRNGTKQMEDGSSSYDGPTDFAPGFPTLVQAIEGGDFEAQSTWYLGLSSDACLRVLALTDDGAPRLVIDVEH